MKTVKAVICDDDPVSIEAVRSHMNALTAEYDAKAEITCFSDGDMLVENYPAGTDFLLLDVEMPLLDGIQAAKTIRERDSHVTILFMSRFERYAINGYYAGAWRYLLKPVTYERFRHEMTVPLEHLLQQKERFITVKNDSGVFVLSEENICYLEVNSKKNVDIHTETDTVESYHTLNTLEEQLDPGLFFRCHKSILVNLRYIVRIEKDTILLRSGTVIPLSRRRRSELMQKFLEYAAEVL